MKTAELAAKQRPRSRRATFEAAMEPLAPVVQALGDPAAVSKLAAALPPEDQWRVNLGARWDGLDPDLNAATAPLRWRSLYVAERADAAHQMSPCDNAIWNWEVHDPTWQAALDAIDVAMAVSALRVDGRPVTDGMADCHRRVLAIASDLIVPDHADVE